MLQLITVTECSIWMTIYIIADREREKTINTENALLYNIFSTCTFIKSFGKIFTELISSACNSQKFLDNMTMQYL